MDRRIAFALTAALCVASPAAARPASGGGTSWSLLGAEVVPAGSNVMSGRFGWPDLTFEYTHGSGNGFDIGGRVSFLYGVENRTNYSSQFGMAFAVPMRWTLSRGPDVRLLFHWDPGLRLYTTDPTLFGFQSPIGLNIEFPIAQPAHVGIGADFAASLFVTGYATPRFFFGPLIGPYFEYDVNPRFALGFDTRFGAIIDAYSAADGFSGGSQSGFGFRAQMTLAYRL